MHGAREMCTMQNNLHVHKQNYVCTLDYYYYYTPPPGHVNMLVHLCLHNLHEHTNSKTYISFSHQPSNEVYRIDVLSSVSSIRPIQPSTTHSLTLKHILEKFQSNIFCLAFAHPLQLILHITNCKVRQNEPRVKNEFMQKMHAIDGNFNSHKYLKKDTALFTSQY